MATAASDDELANADEPSLPKTTVLAVQQWINTPTHIVESQEWALELYTLAPLMFGRSIPRSPAPSAKVFRQLLSMDSRVAAKDVEALVQKATSPSIKPENYLTDEEIERIDFWRVVCKRTLEFLATMSPDQLAALISLWQPLSADKMKPDYCSMLVKQFFQINPSSYVDDTCAAISTFHHFAVLIQRVSVTARFDDLFSEHIALREFLSEGERAVSGVHEKGNCAFKDGDYSRAECYYSEGICRFPFSSVLYGNRAQVNLRRKDARHAVSDGLRCVSLDPTYIKGMWRFAEALFETGNDTLAFVFNRKARRACSNEDSGFIKEQLERFRRALPKDLPNLVGAENDSDDDEDREVKLKSLASKQSTSQTMKPKAKIEPQQRKNSSDTSLVPQNGAVTPSLQVAYAKNAKQQHSARAAGADAYAASADAWVAKLLSELADGAAALLKKSYKPARFHYDLCITLLSSHSAPTPIVDRVANQPVSLPVLRYSCGMACLELDTLPDVNAGMDYFKGISASDDETNFPLAYYGLGRAHMQLGHYRLARIDLQRGQQLLSSASKYPSNLMWPGTTVPIPESCHTKTYFEEALLQCRYPPKPDAICVYDECLNNGNVQREIYLSTCCFEGLVNLTCTRRCRVHYHIKCWQHVKSRMWDKSTHKDFQGGPCITPCCTGRLSHLKIIVRRSGEDKVSELPFNVEKHNGIKPRRPLLKIPAQSDRTIERKKQRKLERKERRAQTSQHSVSVASQPTVGTGNTDTSSDKTSALSASRSSVTDTEHIRMTQEEPVAVIKKDKDVDIVKKDSVKHKTSKKKIKSKTIHLDEFIGRSNCDDETDSASIDSGGPSAWYSDIHRLAPSSMPFQLQLAQEDSTMMYTGDQPSLAAPDMQQSLVRFFEELLREHGKLHVEDVAITRYLVDCFPPEALIAVSDAGGIAGFLSQYPQFDLVDDHLMLRSSAGFLPATEVVVESQPRMITPRMPLRLPLPQQAAALHLQPSALPLAPYQALVNNWIYASPMPRPYGFSPMSVSVCEPNVNGRYGNGLLPMPSAYGVYRHGLVRAPTVDAVAATAASAAMDPRPAYLSTTTDHLPAPSVTSNDSYCSSGSSGCTVPASNAGLVVNEEIGYRYSNGARISDAYTDNRLNSFTKQGTAVTTTLTTSSFAGSAARLASSLLAPTASQSSGCEVGPLARMLDSFNYPVRLYDAVGSVRASVSVDEGLSSCSEKVVPAAAGDPAADRAVGTAACDAAQLRQLDIATNAACETMAAAGFVPTSKPKADCIELHSVSDLGRVQINRPSFTLAASPLPPLCADEAGTTVTELAPDPVEVALAVVPAKSLFATDLVERAAETEHNRQEQRPLIEHVAVSSSVAGNSGESASKLPTTVSSPSSTLLCGKATVRSTEAVAHFNDELKGSQHYLFDRSSASRPMVDASVQVELEPLSPPAPLLVENGVQVDGLREECEILKVTLQVLKDELLCIREEKALHEIRASQDRERFSVELQIQEDEVKRLSRDLAVSRDKLGAVRQALGEHSRTTGVSSLNIDEDLADDVVRLRTLLADEVTRRRATEVTCTEHAETVQRLQTELRTTRRAQADSESEWDKLLEQQCLRARQAEAALVELQYERAAAPLFALLRCTKQCLDHGSHSPSIANALVVLFHRLNRAIMELKTQYEEQLMMVASGRLLSSLRSISHLDVLGSPEELRVLTAVAPVQALLHPPKVPRLSVAHAPARRTADGAASPIAFSAAPATVTAGSRTYDEHAVSRQLPMYAERTGEELTDRLIRVSAARDSSSGSSSPSSWSHSSAAEGASRVPEETRAVGQYRPLQHSSAAAAAAGASVAGPRMDGGDASASSSSISWPPVLPVSSRRPAVSSLSPAAFRDGLALQYGTDPCCICHEQMHADDVTKLSCQHYYHTSCIKNWFEVQKTCPLCRTFDLIPEDYPDLNSQLKP